MIHETIIPFIWLIIPCITLAVLYRIRTTYKIEQLKQEGKTRKSEKTLEGSLTKFIDSAPDSLKTLESELATLEEKAKREHLTPEQTESLLSRLKMERDALRFTSSYGDVAKPFVKPLVGMVEKLFGGLGGR